MGGVRQGGEGTLPLGSEGDVLVVRRRIREVAEEVGLELTDVTRIVAGAAEWSRKVVAAGGGGRVAWRVIRAGERRGLEVALEDGRGRVTPIARRWVR